MLNRLRIRTKLVLTLLGSMGVAMLLMVLALAVAFLSLRDRAESQTHNPITMAIVFDRQSRAVGKALESGGTPQEVFRAAVPSDLPAGVRVRLIDNQGWVWVDSAMPGSAGGPGGSGGRPAAAAEVVELLSTMGQQGSRTMTIPAPLTVSGRGWGLYLLTFESSMPINISLNDGSRESRLASLVLLGGLLLAMLASVLQFWFLGRHLVGPVRRLSVVVGQIAAGDLDARANLGSRGDELGQLARDIDTMAARLQQARDQAAAADKARRYLVAAASHDLRTPLTAMLAHVEAIRTGISEDAGASLAVVQEKGLLLKRLLSDLFELAALDAAHERWQTVRTDVAELVRLEVVGVLPELEAAGFAVDAEIPDGPLWAALAPGKLERVLDNLLTNARKYGEPGRWLGVRVTPAGGSIRVEVCEAGLAGAACRGAPVGLLFPAGGRGRGLVGRRAGGGSKPQRRRGCQWSGVHAGRPADRLCPGPVTGATGGGGCPPAGRRQHDSNVGTARGCTVRAEQPAEPGGDQGRGAGSVALLWCG